MKRQGILFVVAIVIPSLLLVGLSLRMLTQEKELADSRAAEERSQMAGQVGQQLLAHLARVSLDALRAPVVSAPGERRTWDANDSLALIATIEDNQVVLPWDQKNQKRIAPMAASGSAFAEALRLGEQEEFARTRFLPSADAYRRAEALASTPEEHAAAQLGLARVLANANHGPEASAIFIQLVKQPLDVVDDQAVPFAMYAASRLLAGSPSERIVRESVLRLIQTALTEPGLSPAALYMARDLAAGLTPGSPPTLDLPADVHPRIRNRIDEVEQALALQAAFGGSALAAPTASTNPMWLPFGPDEHLWLVANTASPEGATRLLIAARAAPVMATIAGGASIEGASLRTGVEGEPLGPRFPGVSVTLPSNGRLTRDRLGALQRTFYLGALFLVLSVALSGGYLFWRDVRRDVRLSAMRSQFVSSVSHELKTPLTAIRMFAETLQMGRTAPADRDEYLDTIVNESERLTRLINNVLDFSKIEQGRRLYHLEPNSLAAAVQSAARTMQYPLAQQGFELRVVIDEALPEVPSDPDALEQATLNLLSNAMKYSGAGRSVDLELTRDGNHAIIAVTDRGVGIPAVEHTKIFDKFYRVAQTGPHIVPGAGLGLTLVEHIAQAHGGRVTVRSAPGEGSTFSIVLPLAPGTGVPAPVGHLQSQTT